MLDFYLNDDKKCKNWEQSEILWDMERFSLSWLGHHFPWTRQWSFGNFFFPQHQVCVELKLEQWRGCFSSFWMLQQHKSPARLSFSGFVWQKVGQWFEFFNFHLYYMSARYLSTNFYLYIYCRYLFHSSVHTPFFLKQLSPFSSRNWPTPNELQVSRKFHESIRVEPLCTLHPSENRGIFWKYYSRDTHPTWHQCNCGNRFLDQSG